MQSAEMHMRRALELAERGRGYVEPNPLVGAVLVRDGVVVGEGFHEKFGQAHAEVNAIAGAGEKAVGATLYVTLEPCCHHGKTPPCTDALIRAGIAWVEAAQCDPFPQVAGKGAAQLEAAGIPISFGVCADESKTLNAPYLTLLQFGRPFVHAKWAMTLDGKIATRTGDSKWISNETSRGKVHRLRGRMDAVVVGIGTALADDPLLTARPAGPRIPVRVVLDSQARLPLTSQLVRTARATPTMIVTLVDAPFDRVEKLREAGCEVFLTPKSKEGVDVAAWLSEMGKRRWTNVLVEGGGKTLGSFFDAGAVDHAHVFVAPKVVGGALSPTPVAGQGIAQIAEFAHWSTFAVEQLGEDVYMQIRRVWAP